MASITFVDNLQRINSEYVLFELPEEFNKSLESGGTLELKEKDGESFFVGEDTVYALTKVDISNTLLVGSEKQANRNQTEFLKDIKIHTLKQSYLSYEETTPNLSEVLTYLEANRIKSGASVF